MVDVTIVTYKTEVQVSETVVQVEIVPNVLHVDLGTSGLPGADGEDGTGGGGSGETPAVMATSTTVVAGDSHKVYTNLGAVALVVPTLPAEAAGLKYTYLVVNNAGGFQLRATNGNTIVNGAAVSSANGTMTGAKKGCTITIRGTGAGFWIVDSAVGVWKEA